MFEYKGGQYTYEDLQKEAEKQGVDFAEFMGKMKKLGMTTVKDTSEGQGLNLDMSSQQSFEQEDDGLDDDLSIMEGFVNSVSNTFGPAMKKRYYDFATGVGGFVGKFGEEAAGTFITELMIGEDYAKNMDRAAGFLDPETGGVVVFDNAAYKLDGHDATENKRYYELVKEFRGQARYGDDDNPDRILNVFADTKEDVRGEYGEALQKAFDKSFEQTKKLKRTTDKGVTGFIDAVKKGELDDALVQGVDFLMNTTVDMALARVTMGVSMGAQMYGSSFATYNDERSKLLYGEDDPDRVQKLFENGEDRIGVPAALGGVGFLLERAGYKGIMTELAKKSFGGKKAVSLLVTGNKEGLTEYGQALTERLNKNFGQGMGVLDAVKDVSRYMWTEEAWDQYFAGLIGGAGMGGGGAIVQGALRSDETSNKFINDKINEITALQEFKARNPTKNNIKKYDDAIQIKETELKEYLEANKKLGDYLNETEIVSLTNFVNSRRDISAKILDLKKGLKKGVVSEADYTAKVEALQNQLTAIDADIKTVKTDANMRLLKKDLDAGSAFVGNVDGLTQEVYDTPAEFFAALEQEYKAQGKAMPNFEGINIHGLKIGNKFLINAKVAAEVNAVATSTHEVLHGIVKSTVQADDGTGHLSAKGVAIVNSFVDQLSRKEKALIEGLLKDGGYKVNKDGTDKDFKEYGEEYLTMYAQLSKEGKFTKNNIQKAGIWFSNLLNKETEFKKISFKDGESTKAFLDAYASGDKVALEQSVALAKEGVKMKETPEQFSKESTNAINELGKVDKDGNNLEEKGTGNFYYQAEADDIVRTIEEKGYLDGLIRSKYKAEKVPPNFVKQVMSELSAHIKAYKPERKNESGLFGWINPQISNKATAVYNREYKVDDEMKGAKDSDAKGKEGEVKLQIAAETSSEMKAIEEKDMSIAAQIKENKAKKEGKTEEQQYSEYRQKLEFETGSKIYNEVLENVKKSLMIAYGTTQNIKDVQLRAQAIALKLKKEYANLNSPLFKQIKNFLTYGIADTKVPYGTKDTYISNLKKLREGIVKNTSTADLVQMERNTPEADRVFTDFVKVLTSIDPEKLYSIEHMAECLNVSAETHWNQVVNVSDRELTYINSVRKSGEKIWNGSPRIKISTIHKAKGGEADNVLLILDNTITIRDAIEKSPDKEDEENRIWYVGVTRTKQNLYIMAAKKEAKGYDIESLG